MSSLYYLYVDTFSILWTLFCGIFSSGAELTIYQEFISPVFSVGHGGIELEISQTNAPPKKTEKPRFPKASYPYATVTSVVFDLYLSKINLLT